METLDEAKARRANWAIPKHNNYPQCFFCGHIANGHTSYQDRYVPTCGYRHNKDMKRSEQ